MYAFSVIVPAFNRPDLLLDCLGSLEGQRGAYEVIIVDDGSTDGTAEAAEAFIATHQGVPMRLIRQANAGPGAARNRAAEAATGRWLAFLDSDDLWLPWTVEALAGVLAEAATDAPRVIFLQTAPFTERDSLAAIGRQPVTIVRHPTMLEMRLDARLAMLGACNTVIRRDAFAALGGFTTEVRCGEDTDLFYRAGALGEVWSVTSPVLVGYRTGNADSLTHSVPRMRAATRYILRRNGSGAYPGAPALRETALARTVTFALRDAFAVGDVRSAYATYLDAAGLFWRRRDWNALVRLPLTPVLSLVRPRNYRFSWRRLRR